VTDTLERLRTTLADRYRLERELGAGGMATVYLAHDLKHDRRVAIKVLRPELAAVVGAERFLAEIRVTANLQHPYILPLHDSGEAGGSVFYVMPYVEGESLRDRLTREKQLPVEDALRIATEVAGALDYAHRRGVIHRDIKPENILLHEGQALVADFGIALAMSSAGASRMTETGMSLGTPHYMSPEQAMGERDVTAKTDIYALGCVLYEMLLGEPPFTGPSAQAIVAKVMTEEPRPICAQRRTVPPHVEAAILTALQKLPADRFPTAADFANAIARPGSQYVANTNWATGRRLTPARRAGRMAVALGGVAVITAAVAVPLLWRRGRPASEAPSRRFHLILPDSAPLDYFAPSYFGEGRPALALSPDGKVLVYVARVKHGTQLYQHRLDQDGFAPITGTEGAADPFFSPDGNWVGFVASGELRKVQLTGGPPVTVAPVQAPFGMAWLKDGRIITIAAVGPMWVNATGGEWQPLPSGSGTAWAVYPQVIPGERWGLSGGWGLYLYRFADGLLLRLASGRTLPAESSSADALGGSGPLYAASGHVLYIADSTLMALPFDPAKPDVLGPPVPVVAGVRREAWGGASQMALAGDGTFIYAPGGNAGRAVAIWADATGRVRDTLPLPRGAYYDLAVSRDGQRLALETTNSTGKVEGTVVDAATGLSRARPGDSDEGNEAFFWPDGRRVVVLSGGRSIAYSVVGPPAADTLMPAGWQVLAVSPNARWFVTRGTGDSSGLWLAPREGRGPRARLPVRVGPSTFRPAFSPDSRWVVYRSVDGLYVSPVPATGEVFKVAPLDATEPLWAPRGYAIYYRTGPRWMTVPISTSGSFRAAEPRLLFTGRFLQIAGKSYGVGPDGRFLLLVGPPQETTTRLNVITNFFGELRRLAPTGRGR
jgi:eukaryotic-like serine/threonine-protein kinase